jgi:hypothetical protein
MWRIRGIVPPFSPRFVVSTARAPTFRFICITFHDHGAQIQISGRDHFRKREQFTFSAQGQRITAPHTLGIAHP